jgi:diguanylate cyclase (GGDEF)-like protein
MDDFKKINDELGHFYGDKTITDAADGIDHCLRTTDIKGRIGGDEFMVLLKNVPQDQQFSRKLLKYAGRSRRPRLWKGPVFG